MEKKTIVLATYGKTREHQHGECMDALRYQLGIEIFDTKAHSQIDQARSLLATYAMAHGADVALFIDHDTIFNPLDVEVLADVAREKQCVVGAAYSTRKLGGNIVGGPDSSKYEEVTFYEGGGLYDAVNVVGMGFTAIHRSVFEKLDELPEYAEANSGDGMMRPYFKKLIIDGFWYKEDASFCHAARSVGVTTLIDTRIRIKHLGDHAFGIEDCRIRSPDQSTLKLRLQPAKS